MDQWPGNGREKKNLFIKTRNAIRRQCRFFFFLGVAFSKINPAGTPLDPFSLGAERALTASPPVPVTRIMLRTHVSVCAPPVLYSIHKCGSHHGPRAPLNRAQEWRGERDGRARLWRWCRLVVVSRRRDALQQSPYYRARAVYDVPNEIGHHRPISTRILIFRSYGYSSGGIFKRVRGKGRRREEAICITAVYILIGIYNHVSPTSQLLKTLEFFFFSLLVVIALSVLFFFLFYNS